MDPVTGSLIGAIAGPILGGLFGSRKSSSKNQTTTTKVKYDFQQLRRSALKAGFNPLTALKFGQSSGSTTVTDGPQLSSGNFIAEALERGLTTWFNRDQIRADAEADRLKVDIMREELAQLQKENYAPSSRHDFGFSIPQIGTTSNSQQNVAPPLAYQAVSDPVLVGRNDGLTAVNQDNPVEAEADIWGWLREGTFWPNMGTIYGRNRPFAGAHAAARGAGSFDRQRYDAAIARSADRQMRDRALRASTRYGALSFDHSGYAR